MAVKKLDQNTYTSFCDIRGAIEAASRLIYSVFLSHGTCAIGVDVPEPTLENSPAPNPEDDDGSRSKNWSLGSSKGTDSGSGFRAARGHPLQQGQAR